jgi:hypothetical protein
MAGKKQLLFWGMKEKKQAGKEAGCGNKIPRAHFIAGCP